MTILFALYTEYGLANNAIEYIFFIQVTVMMVRNSLIPKSRKGHEGPKP